MVKNWDIFISHASEDKKAFVRPLATALHQMGVSVWYDEFTLNVGDSISRSIDKGLASSRYGLVIISKAFIGKKWTEHELRGLVMREIEEDKVILPIWHGVTREQVIDFSPPLADKIAIKTEKISPQDVAIQILRAVRPDIYQKRSHPELEILASGDAVIQLQREMDRISEKLEETKEALSQFQCPTCEAPMVEQFVAPLSEEWDEFRETYECGFEKRDYSIYRLCPSDPNFPKFDEFELNMWKGSKENSFCTCQPKPLTPMAKKLPLDLKQGFTEEDVRKRIFQQYKNYSKKWRG